MKNEARRPSSTEGSKYKINPSSVKRLLANLPHQGSYLFSDNLSIPPERQKWGSILEISFVLMIFAIFIYSDVRDLLDYKDYPFARALIEAISQPRIVITGSILFLEVFSFILMA